MRARGLKPPYAQACLISVGSRPLRARGLKPDEQEMAVQTVETSRPLRARGLKHELLHLKIIYDCRAPCGRVG